MQNLVVKIPSSDLLLELNPTLQTDQPKIMNLLKRNVASNMRSPTKFSFGNSPTSTPKFSPSVIPNVNSGESQILINTQRSIKIPSQTIYEKKTFMNEHKRAESMAVNAILEGYEPKQLYSQYLSERNIQIGARVTSPAYSTAEFGIRTPPKTSYQQRRITSTVQGSPNINRLKNLQPSPLSLNEVLDDIRRSPSANINSMSGSRVGLSLVLQQDILNNLAEDAKRLKLVGSKSLNLPVRAQTSLNQPTQSMTGNLKLNHAENPDSPLFNLKYQKTATKNSVFQQEKSYKKINFLDQLTNVYEKKLSPSMDMMAKFRKSFMKEVFTYNKRRAKDYNTQQLIIDLKEELVGKEQRVLARNAALKSSQSRRKVMQSRKLYQGAYYEFKSLQKQTQERIQAKIDEKARISSPLFKMK